MALPWLLQLWSDITDLRALHVKYAVIYHRYEKRAYDKMTQFTCRRGQNLANA